MEHTNKSFNNDSTDPSINYLCRAIVILEDKDETMEKGGCGIIAEKEINQSSNKISSLRGFATKSMRVPLKSKCSRKTLAK